MKHSIRHTVFALVVMFLVSACAGGEKPMDAAAPNDVGGLARDTYLTGADAAAKIDEFHMRDKTSGDSWAAAYAGDRVWLFGVRFATPEEAATAVGTMVKMAGMGGKYTNPEPKNIAYQAGYQMRNTEDNRFTFFYAKHRWVVAVNAIAPDLEVSVDAVEWTPVAS